MPSLFILAGANGSGKTTFYFSAKENNFISSAVPFVNIDMIAKEELGVDIQQKILKEQIRFTGKGLKDILKACRTL